MPALAGVAVVLCFVLMSVGRLRSQTDLPSVQLPVGHSDAICRLWEVPVVQVTLDSNRKFHLLINDTLLQAKLTRQVSTPVTAIQMASSLHRATQLSQLLYQKPIAIWLRADQCISSREVMALFHQLRQHGINRVFLVMETEQT